jgi:hypothetical protein
MPVPPPEGADEEDQPARVPSLHLPHVLVRPIIVGCLLVYVVELYTTPPIQGGFIKLHHYHSPQQIPPFSPQPTKTPTTQRPTKTGRRPRQTSCTTCRAPRSGSSATPATAPRPPSCRSGTRSWASTRAVSTPWRGQRREDDAVNILGGGGLKAGCVWCGVGEGVQDTECTKRSICASILCKKRVSMEPPPPRPFSLPEQREATENSLNLERCESQGRSPKIVPLLSVYIKPTCSGGLEKNESFWKGSLTENTKITCKASIRLYCFGKRRIELLGRKKKEKKSGVACDHTYTAAGRFIFVDPLNFDHGRPLVCLLVGRN